MKKVILLALSLVCIMPHLVFSQQLEIPEAEMLAALGEKKGTMLFHSDAHKFDTGTISLRLNAKSKANKSRTLDELRFYRNYDITIDCNIREITVKQCFTKKRNKVENKTCTFAKKETKEKEKEKEIINLMCS